MKKFILPTLTLLALASTASAQIVSTASGGNFADGGSWVGGIKPTNGNFQVVANSTITMQNGDSITDNNLPVNRGTLTLNTGSVLTINRYNNNINDATAAILNIAGGNMTTNRLAGAASQVNITSGRLNVVGGIAAAYNYNVSGGTLQSNAIIQAQVILSTGGTIDLRGAGGADISSLNMGQPGSSWNGGTVVLNTITTGDSFRNAFNPFQGWKTNDANILKMSSGASAVTTGDGTQTGSAISSTQGTMAFNLYGSTTNNSDKFDWNNSGNSLSLSSGVDISITGLSLAGVTGDYIGKSYQFFDLTSYTNVTPTISATVLTIGGTDYNVGWSNNLATTGSLTIATLTAIPEPSAYAALAGLGAIGLVALRRRRA